MLHATLDVIAEQGVMGISVDTVAARSGVSKATIYRHWGSRARLIHAAISSLQPSTVEPDTGILRDDLSALLRHLVDYFDTAGTPLNHIVGKLVALSMPKRVLVVGSARGPIEKTSPQVAQLIAAMTERGLAESIALLGQAKSRFAGILSDLGLQAPKELGQ